MSQWIGESMDGCVDGWTDRQVDGWIDDGWMDE